MAALGSVGTASCNVSCGVSALASLDIDLPSAATGADTFTVQLAAPFRAAYPVIAFPLSQTTVDGAAAACGTGLTVVSTSLNATTLVLTVNVNNVSGSPLDLTSQRWIFVQLTGEGE